jgi:hypothetical protein
MGVYAGMASALNAGPVVVAIIGFGVIRGSVSFAHWAVDIVAGFFDGRAEAAWSKRMQEIGRQSIAGNKDEVKRLVERENRRG